MEGIGRGLEDDDGEADTIPPSLVCDAEMDRDDDAPVVNILALWAGAE